MPRAYPPTERDRHGQFHHWHQVEDSIPYVSNKRNGQGKNHGQGENPPKFCVLCRRRQGSGSQPGVSSMPSREPFFPAEAMSDRQPALHSEQYPSQRHSGGAGQICLRIPGLRVSLPATGGVTTVPPKAGRPCGRQYARERRPRERTPIGAGQTLASSESGCGWGFLFPQPRFDYVPPGQ
jgi:hypothetical protein